MVTKRPAGPVRIGPKKPHRIFIKEWRESLQPTMTQDRLAERLETTKTSVSRWEAWGEGERDRKKAREPSAGTLQAIAEALGRSSAADLFYPPGTGGSPWAILATLPPERQNDAAKLLLVLREAS